MVACWILCSAAHFFICTPIALQTVQVRTAALEKYLNRTEPKTCHEGGKKTGNIQIQPAGVAALIWTVSRLIFSHRESSLSPDVSWTLRLTDLFRAAAEVGPQHILKMYNTNGGVLNISPQLEANSQDSYYRLEVVASDLKSEGCRVHFVKKRCVTNVLKTSDPQRW